MGQGMTRMSMTKTLGAVVGAVLLASAGPAAAGVRDDVRDLQERMARAEQSLSGQSAATVRISQLEREIQVMTGRIEELTFQLNQANSRLDAISAALAGGQAFPGDAGAAYFPPGDAGGAPAVRSGPTDLTTGDPVADQGGAVAPASALAEVDDVALPLDPGAAFDYASRFLLQGDYARAKAAFELYLEAFPNHPRTPDAQFRLGEIYMAVGENAAAADAFIAHIRDYPNDPRSAEAYLKLGSAFARLDKPDEACTVFKTMKSKFPGASGPVSQRVDLEMARIDCQ